MLDKERLIKAPTITAEEVAEDDYIMIDSPTLGVRKYLASKLVPEPEYLYNWDLTQSLYDKVNNVLLDTNETLQPNIGLLFNYNSGYANILPDTFDWMGKTLEIETGDMDNKASYSLNYIISGSKCSIFWYRSGGERWAGNAGNGYVTENIIPFDGNTDPRIFSNSTIKAVYEPNEFKVYKNDILVFKTIPASSYTYNGNNKVRIGASTTPAITCYYDMVIKAIRIYETIEEV